MARFVPKNPDVQPISLEDYLEHCDRELDPDDEDSIFAGAGMLQALAANKAILVDRLNEYFRTDTALNEYNTYSSMTMMLAVRPKYLVRANTWVKPKAYAPSDTWEQTLYSYDYPHNHNFSLLTAGHHGSGYKTDLYRLKAAADITGYAGEKVDLTYDAQYQLGCGDVLLYERVQDVHIQRAPEELSISFNLMPLDSRISLTEQFAFDVADSTIASLVGSQVAHQSDLLRMAACVGDSNTLDVLLRLASRHRNQSTRLAAIEAAASLSPSDAERIWEIGLKDKSEIVRRGARANVLQTSTPMAQ